MLVIQRQAHLHHAPARRAYWGISNPRLRVYVTECHQLMHLIPPSGPQLTADSRLNLVVLLDGTMHVRRAGVTRTLAPGEWILEPAQGGELWDGADFRVLAVEWDVHVGSLPLGETRFGCVTAVQRHQLRALATHLRGLDPFDQVASWALCQEVVAALDLDVEVERSEASAAELTLTASLARLTSHLDRQPMWSDLEEVGLGLGERQLRRHLAGLLLRLGLPPSVSGLRRYLRQHRLLNAMAFVTAPGVSLEQVAASVGYGSARALCTAFRQAGMPSPFVWRRLVLSGEGM